MEDVFSSAMQDAVIKTFSDMAFIDVVSENSTLDIQIDNILKIDITEPVEWEIYFCLSNELKKTLIENIFSVDFSEVKESQIDDCLLEVLNVLAGNFTGNYFGKDTFYKIDFPEVIFETKNFSKGKKNVLLFNAEGIYFEIIYCKKRV